MKHPLAILTPTLGAKSETFIHRQVNDLLPGGCAVITSSSTADAQSSWRPAGPCLFTGGKPGSGIARLRGWFRFPPFASKSDSTEQLVRRFLDVTGVRVVLGQSLTYSHEFLALFKRMGVRFFAHAHGYDVADWCLNDPAWRKKYLDFNHSDGVITMSHFSRKRLVELGIRESIVHVVPYGVDVPERPVFNEDEKVVRCIAVGRMTPKKAPLLLLQSFHSAFLRNSSLRLDYIGEGPLYDRAKQFIEDYGLKSVVTLHGGLPNREVQSFFKQSHIFLQHSITDPETGDQEGLPVSILEAMAHALPVLSTLHSAIPEAVIDQISGFLVGEGDVTAMSERLLLLADDLTLRHSMGMAGHRIAKENFSWSLEKSRLLDVLGVSPAA